MGKCGSWDTLYIYLGINNCLALIKVRFDFSFLFFPQFLMFFWNAKKMAFLLASSLQWRWLLTGKWISQLTVVIRCQSGLGSCAPIERLHLNALKTCLWRFSRFLVLPEALRHHLIIEPPYTIYDERSCTHTHTYTYIHTQGEREEERDCDLLSPFALMYRFYHILNQSWFFIYFLSLRVRNLIPHENIIAILYTFFPPIKSPD